MHKWRKSTKRWIQWKRPNRRKIFQFVDIKLEKKNSITTGMLNSINCGLNLPRNKSKRLEVIQNVNGRECATTFHDARRRPMCHNLHKFPMQIATPMSTFNF